MRGTTTTKNPREKISARSSRLSDSVTSRDKLLRAGFLVFSENGYHGSTTKQIAATAGVNESLIMRHFKSKEGLFLSVIETNVSPCGGELPYPPAATLEEELWLFARSMFEKNSANSKFLRIVIGQSMLNEDFAHRLSNQLEPTRRDALHARLLQLKAKGKLPASADLRALEETLSQQIFGAMFFSQLVGAIDPKTALGFLKTATKAFARSFGEEPAASVRSGRA